MQTANAVGELLPLDCIDRGGLSLQRKVHLGCNFPAYFYLQQHAGNPERHGYSFQTRSSLGFLSTVKSRATASGSLQSPAFRRLRREHHRESARCRFRCCLLLRTRLSGLLGTPLFLGVISNSLEAPNGDGVGRPGTVAGRQASSSIAFHWKTKSALVTFTQPHSISREVGAGLSTAGRTEANSWRRAQGHLLGEPGLGSLALLSSLGWSGACLQPHAQVVCFSGARAGAVCFWREEAPALGFGYCFRSEDAVSVAGAHHSGGSLAGGT